MNGTLLALVVNKVLLSQNERVGLVFHRHRMWKLGNTVYYDCVY